MNSVQMEIPKDLESIFQEIVDAYKQKKLISISANEPLPDKEKKELPHRKILIQIKL